MNTIRRRRFRTGFTLTELLVVIGIIGLLVALLLPALNKARRQAYTIKCASNMREIALSMLMYISDNHGILMPASVSATGIPNNYQYGCFWAAELVHLGYINAPPLVINTATSTVTPPDDMGVFQCPEGIPPTDWGNLTNTLGQYPTDPNNNAWTYGGIPNFSALSPNPYATGTYYQLNCRQTGYVSNYTTGGLNNPPFVWFVAPTDNLGITTAADLSNMQYRRKITQITHTETMVMIGESANLFWVSNTTSTVNGVVHYAPSVGARHGARTSDGTNAYTNFAFFDGHVALFPTAPIDSTAAPASNPGTDGCSAMTHSSGTVFTFYNDDR
jgi:prepilin-type N-terminal cleavage/methylation domain-containing protein/prepilin-type processing-associated H-X9-DG protein